MKGNVGWVHAPYNTRPFSNRNILLLSKKQHAKLVLLLQPFPQFLHAIKEAFGFGAIVAVLEGFIEFAQ